MRAKRKTFRLLAAALFAAFAVFAVGCSSTLTPVPSPEQELRR
ncbi:hypothetical protein [Mycobacterium simiae]|nr:hypothetical protein [Mycobacterium simiae]